MSQYSMNFLPTIISDGPVSAIPETVAETSPPAFESSDFDYLNTVTFGGDGISLAASSGQEAAVMSSRAHNDVGSEGDLEMLVELTTNESRNVWRSQWSANYQMLSGYLKLERKIGFVTASHSHHGALWTMIGSSVELPVALKTAPLKIGMRISRNWNVEYSLTVKPIITSGGAA
eukprot:scaffold3352_cov47-Attheya_sp.AAC.1